MPQFGGKQKKTSSDSKRHFTVVMGGKEHGLYVSSTPSSAARKAVTKLCAANKSKKVEFHIREITQGSKKKTYGPYEGYIEKLKKPIELKGRVIKYKPVAKLGAKRGVQKGGRIENLTTIDDRLYHHIIDGLKKLSVDQQIVLGLRENNLKNNKEIESFLEKSNCYIWKLSNVDPFYLILKITKGIGSSSIYIAFSFNTPPLNGESGTNANIILAIGNSKENFVINLNSEANSNLQPYKQELKNKIRDINFDKHRGEFYDITKSHFRELKFLASQN